MLYNQIPPSKLVNQLSLLGMEELDNKNIINKRKKSNQEDISDSHYI